MIIKKNILGAISSLIVLASANVYAAQLPTKDLLAREATEAQRGADNNNHRQRHGGRASIDNPSDLILAREATEAPSGADNNNQRRRGRVSTDNPGDYILAREATQAPRGADNNNQRRRGRA